MRCVTRGESLAVRKNETVFEGKYRSSVHQDLPFQRKFLSEEQLVLGRLAYYRIANRPKGSCPRHITALLAIVVLYVAGLQKPRVHFVLQQRACSPGRKTAGS